ncbi:MAG TPA: hypothetical protein PKE05_17680, partial [Microthrixaceae bacterium]|nr:hypothetical protein [Microthrixaceae bacterium]
MAPDVSDTMRSAASMISATSSTSRCIHDLGFGEHRVSDQSMNRFSRQQVDRTIEDLCEFGFEVEQGEPEAGIRFEHEQQVDIAGGPGVTPGDRTEDRQLRDPVPPAHFLETISVDLVPLWRQRPCRR